MTQDFSNQRPSGMIQFDIPNELPSIIKVVGVGGGGSNAVNHMFRQGIKGVEFLVCNTDQQALDISPVNTKIQLGPGLTQGRGAGSLPEVGKQAAIENIEELRNMLNGDTKMVFITAGMGGGTGTGAAPIIAGVAREMGILTVGIVTIPFSFEGRKRKQQAELGVEEMKKNVDALLVISNDKLREIYGNLNLSKAFGHADDVLTVAAKSIAEIITNTMHMNVDFADIQTVMKNSGVAIMGSASAEGDNRAVRAAEQALDSPLLNDNHIEGARYILLNIASGNSEVTMDEIGEINDFIQAQAGQSADIIMGIGQDSTLGDKVSVTIIATGFKTSEEIANEHTVVKSDKVIFKLEDDRKEIFQQKEEVKEEVKVVDFVQLNDPMEPVLIIREPNNAPAPEPEIEMDFYNEFMEQDNIIVHQLDEPQMIEFDFPDHSSEPEIAQTNIPVAETKLPVAEEKVIVEDVIPPVVPPVQIPVAVEEPVIRHTLSNEPPRDEQQPQQQVLSPEEEMYRRSRERIMRLKELSYKMSSPNGIADLEKEPAYKRKNVTLDNVPNSGDSAVSRFTLSMDENKPEIRQNNSFLHDRVD